MEKHQVEERITAALNELAKRDAYLLKVNASERSITHRVGLYLQDQFED